MKTEFAYDSLIYSNDVFSQTHPDLLCSSAKLFGLEAPDIETSRVLELGCGNGMNLISHAYSLPEAEFVGIDLGKQHIDYAKKCVDELSLENIDFRQCDLLEMSVEEFGKFDYIIAHGLFSWIPDFVREKTLSLYNEMLTDNGVGYLSYNAYPGWHYHKLASEIAKIHTRNIVEPFEKVEKATEFIKFLGENTVQKDVYKFILQNENFNLEKKNEIAIFHDNLAEINQPFYFHEFADLLDKNGFQFLSEAEYFSMSFQNLPPESKKMIEGMSDIVWQQQYLDFIKGRSFRQTLFCRKDFKLNRQPNPIILDEFYVASGIETASKNPELHTNKVEKFNGMEDNGFEIDHPLTKTALDHLGKIWGDSIIFRELLNTSKDNLESKGVTFENWEAQFQITRAIFMQLILQTKLIEIHSYRPEIFTEVSNKPLINKLAKSQLDKGDLILTNYERVIKVEDSILRHLLESLDGNTSIEEIHKKMHKFVENEKSIGNKAEILKDLSSEINKHLEQFATAGLFVR